MDRLLNESSQKTGLAPGTLVYTGRLTDEAVQMTAIVYDADAISEQRLASVKDIDAPRLSSQSAWLRITGLHDMEKIAAIGESFDIHSLVLEDIVNTVQRPKVDVYDDYLFIVVRAIRLSQDGVAIQSEQISLIVTPGCLISFEETDSDLFANVIRRLQSGKGRIRQRGTDYLAYALIDSIVDHCFPVLESLEDRLEAFEDELLGSPSADILESIHALRRELLFLRRYLWPLGEEITRMLKSDDGLIGEENRIFFQDVHDHLKQLIDTIENFREINASLFELYLTTTSNRMNEIMKVLTIIATIFMPLTFLAGIYGMNFKYMPELETRWGYFGILGFMAAVTGGLLWFFRRRQWL